MRGNLTTLLESTMNRPGIWAEIDDSGHAIRATINHRVILDWDKWGEPNPRGQLNMGAILDMGKAEEPMSDEEKWISLFVQGSRGFSHELVRHRFRTAVSQRSTRYVDESESPWVEHPLITTYYKDKPLAATEPTSIEMAKTVYKDSARELQMMLKDRGVDTTSARKQARGAARGFLGNALLTEMLFSASVAQWKRMLRLRASDAADAEIRLIFTSKILPVLRTSRYGADFTEFVLGPAKDGIGESLIGGGAK